MIFFHMGHMEPAVPVILAVPFELGVGAGLQVVVLKRSLRSLDLGEGFGLGLFHLKLYYDIQSSERSAGHHGGDSERAARVATPQTNQCQPVQPAQPKRPVEYTA